MQREDSAWMLLAWFGLALGSIGIGQLALHLYPTIGFGSPEWEYGITAQFLGSLPLPTVGIAAFLASMLALGRKRLVVATSIALLILGFVVFGALILFWLNAPLALRSSPPVTLIGIKQTAARTTLNGFGFGIFYLATAVMALRRVTRTAGRPINA